MTKKTKLWLPLLVAMVLVATVVMAACTETATVTYVKGADGATGTAPEAQDVTIGEEIALIANPFTYDGHTFAGWSDGSHTYQAGDKYVVLKNVTFTATWTEVGGSDDHVCGHVCDECHKCTDKNCNDPVCADKCNGHDVVETPFVNAPFNGAIGTKSGDTKSLIFFSQGGIGQAYVSTSDEDYNGGDFQYAISDGAITITKGGDSIGTGTIKGNVIALTITLNDQQVAFNGEMYGATVILGGQSSDWYVALDTPVSLLVEFMDLPSNAIIKVDGQVVPSEYLDSVKMDKEHHTIEVIVPDTPIETDITAPVNAILLHSSQTQSGAKISGTLELYSDGNGYLVIQNANFSTPTVECYIEYTLSDGVITITAAYAYDDTPANVTGSGKVVGRTLTVTITNTITGNATDYVFESELYKLTLSNLDNEGASYVQYLPAGYEFEYYYGFELEGYTLSKVVVNDQDEDPSYVDGISISEDTLVVLVWEEKQVEVPDQPTIPTLSGKISDYAGAADATPAVYGYASAEAADGNVLTWTSTLNGNPVITVYSISIFWRPNIYTPQFAVNLGATGISSTAATNAQLKLNGQVIKDKETANAVLTIKISDLDISIYLYKAEDGTRQVLLVSDKGFVTWACTTSEDVAPDHTCEHKCTICQGCLTASCQESACATKCQGHESNTYDGTYVLTGGIDSVGGQSADKFVVNGNELKVYDGSTLKETITLTWTGNSATGEWNGYYELTITVNEYEMAISISLGYTTKSFTFYLEGHEPQEEENDYAALLADYEGNWVGGEVMLEGTYMMYETIKIEDGKIILISSDSYTPDEVLILLSNSEDDGHLIITFERQGSRGVTDTGTITFLSTERLTVELNGGSAVTYSLEGTEDTDPGTDPDEPGELEGDVYTGEVTGNAAGTSGTIVVTKVIINTATKTAYIEFTVGGGDLQKVTFTFGNGSKIDYEGSKTNLEYYYESDTQIAGISTFQYSQLALYSDGTLQFCVNDKPFEGSLTLESSDDNNKDDDNDNDDDDDAMTFTGEATSKGGWGNATTYTFTKFVFDGTNLTVTYTVSVNGADAKEDTATLTLSSYPQYAPDGVDQNFYYEVMLEGVAYNIGFNSDHSTLYFCDSDDNVLAEFTK